MRRWWRIALVVGLIGAVELLTASPGHAALTGTCDATGTVVGQGRTYDAQTTNKVTLPLEDKVEWAGSVAGGDENGEGPRRQIEGEVRLKMPPGVPFSTVQLGDWGPKESTRYANSGTYDYELPSILGGATVHLTGFHKEAGAEVCSGEVEIELEGTWGNPALYGALAITALSAAGLVIAAVR
jgi:hypothetical protein